MLGSIEKQTVWRVKREDHEWVILGKQGQIAQYEDGELDVWVTSPVIAGRLERGGWKAEHHYDDGAFFIRPWGDLDQAAKAIRAPKRKHLSPAQRKLATERLSRYRYRKTAGTPHVGDTPGGDGN